MPGNETLDVTEVAKLLHLSRNYIWRLAKNGKIPRPVHISPRGRVESVDEIGHGRVFETQARKGRERGGVRIWTK
jgi:hypothetical protein